MEKSFGSFEAQSLICTIGKEVGMDSFSQDTINNEDNIRGFVHDIKSPLSVLGLLLPRVRSVDGEVAELMSATIDQIESLSKRLVQGKQIRNFSNPGNFSIYALQNKIALLVNSKRIEFSQFDLQIKCGFTKSIQCRVPGDINEWESIISNLINNAIENSPVRSRIDISVITHNQSLEIKIFDEGSGLTPEQINSFNCGSTFSSKGAGRGIGLKTAMKYLGAIGGSLQFYSREVKGVYVAIRAPIVKY